MTLLIPLQPVIAPALTGGERQGEGEMAGDADMGHDEIVGRLALLEACVAKLIEIEARRLEEKGGRPAVDGLFYSLGESVRFRTNGMAEAQQEHVGRVLNLLANAVLTMLEPDDRAKN